MDNKIKLKSNIIKPHLNKNKNKNKIMPLNNLLDVYFIHKITPFIYETIIK